MGELPRIYYLATDLEWGGAEKNLVALATALRGEYRVAAGCLFAPGGAARALEAAGVSVDCFDLRGWRDLSRILRIARRLRELRVDLLHSFLFHANIAGRMAAALAGTRRVLGSVRVAEQRRWHLIADGLTQALVHAETGTGAAICRHTARHARVCPRKLVAVPIAIDPDDYAHPAPLPHPGTGCRLLGVGRLHPQKRWGDLVDALVRLRDADWTAAIAGHGPERDVLAARIAAAGLADRIELLGHRSDVHAEYRAADLVVLSSAWEGMPNAVLEAMAHGRPVVATDVGATAELVEHGRTGYVCPPRRPDRLAEALAALIGDPARRAAFGRAGRERAFSTFGLSRMVDVHRRVYRAVLARRPFRSNPDWSVDP